MAAGSVPCIVGGTTGTVAGVCWSICEKARGDMGDGSGVGGVCWRRGGVVSVSDPGDDKGNGFKWVIAEGRGDAGEETGWDVVDG